MRSTISSKSRNIDFYLEKISDIGFEVDCLKLFTTAGDIRPPYPYQWQAITKLRFGDDDVLDNVGETPLKAVKNLYIYIKGIIDIPMEDEE